MNEIQLVTADPASLAAAESAKQRIQAAYTIAIANRRNQEQSRQNILAACKRPKFAEKAMYDKPVGKDRIKGPSIRFAETALREWGNIMSDIQVVYDDEGSRRIKVYLTDLETNTQFAKEISLSKTVERRNAKDREVVGERKNTYGDTVYIVKATEDELANKEGGMISKVLRNEGLRLIPGDVIDEAMEIVAETIARGAKEEPDAQKRKLLDAFLAVGIRANDIETFLGHPLSRITPKEITELRGIYQAIKDGESKWEDYLPEKAKHEVELPADKPAAKKGKSDPAPDDTLTDVERLLTLLKKQGVKYDDAATFAASTGMELDSEKDAGTILASWETFVEGVKLGPVNGE